jgi:hypothetical protein
MANEASEKFNKASDKVNEIGEKASEKVTSAFSSATSDSSDVDSSPLSRSSSSSEGGKMEAADEGRKAEDIPSSEIENSLHQAEVSAPLSIFTSISRGTTTDPSDLFFEPTRKLAYPRLPGLTTVKPSKKGIVIVMNNKEGVEVITCVLMRIKAWRQLIGNQMIIESSRLEFIP